MYLLADVWNNMELVCRWLSLSLYQKWIFSRCCCSSRSIISSSRSITIAHFIHI